MRAIDPPLRAGAGDVLRVDGRELRTLGVVGVHGAARAEELHGAVRVHDAKNDAGAGVVGVHGAARGDEHGVVAVWAAVRECISSPKKVPPISGYFSFFNRISIGDIKSWGQSSRVEPKRIKKT